MLDHLVYVVPDLDSAIDRFTAAGYPPAPGGRHSDRGTYNALLRLGPRSYLELLAVDPETTVAPPRWMGIDLVEGPAITRWAVHAGAVNFPGALYGGSRQLADGRTLRWRLSDPGVRPAVDVVPFVIEWNGSDFHPAERLPDHGLRLQTLQLEHPRPAAVNTSLERMGLPQKAIRGAAPKIGAVLRGPQGTLHL
ncbi:VOC family protein [Neolewinella litorea]|uniref:VOC family protein n=1 Tax=Neolewinella litorea TaxID=2562452 RepID=A0A4S4NFK5_9BACT|nr:VOC family protein [Neolewinella litorea]THH37585.1 VOC family protein [Neolewinella litorea]